MSDDKPIALEGIPVFTGNLATLDTKVTELTSAAETIATTTGDVHSSFGGLQAFYQAPEAEQLFATTKPVVDTGQKMKSDLTTISRALSTYSDEVYPLVEKLKEIKRDAGAFLVKINADDKWREDGDLIDENNHRRDEIADTLAAFQDAEITCHNKIVALVCGVPLKKSDGSDSAHQYGFDAETYKHAEGLPWGDPLVESIPGWQVWEHAWEFTKGFFVDGVWGTIKGLGTLVGFDGFDAAGQAWKGLAQLATGVAISLSPVAAVQFWTADEKDMPGWLRDSRNAVKETGKALVAWDQWGDNPSRAAGAVTFNVVTTVFTGGTGAAASGAGKTALAAKALSAAGKVGRIVDPMTYVFKGAGVGLSKIGDVMAGLKGLGKIEIPPLPDNVFTLPDGWTRLPDGTLDVPAGATLPEGATRLPDGAVKLPEGTIALPPNTLKSPFDEGSAYADIDGNLYDEHGNLVEKGANARKEQGKTADPNTPDHTHLETPVRQPVLVGAGAREGDGLGDVGRVGDNLPGGGIPDRSPGGVANNMPSNSLDTHGGTGRPGDGTSGGGSSPTHGGDTSPSNSPDVVGNGSGHTDTPSTGGPGHNLPGSAAGDSGIRGADAAAHRAEYEAAREKPASSRTPEERAVVTREHVRLANEDPVWRAQHYDKWGLGKRNNADALVDDQLLPKLVEKSDGSWMSAEELPYASAEEFHLTDLVRGRDTVDPQGLAHLDEVSAKRKAGMELTAAQKSFDKTPTAEAAQALADAQKLFDDTVGPGVSNNSKLGEALGEEAARRHMLQLKEFEGAREITDLPDTPNGSRRFDQLWRDKDGNLVIVEAKGPKGVLLWRQGYGELDSRTSVKQGTLEYVRTIVAEMEERATFSPKDAKYAAEIKDAIADETLRYVLVQATENTGQYAGAELRHFKIL
ncbi:MULTISPECIES: hypothetical protein [unclassified Streptomyces]|uniref:hypothetical protein n=1 Tax=unclassified Streptomyces TaxID=2593676 RepID=UPI0001C1D047|nr:MULTISPECIES: hypothetical protein [unclassified Streptomyces]MYR67000.1 hypothetical protein [Streptomyces sp. SID4939]MYS02052.1 hypothetical protein [Streptomyces sp. SID4940]MYT67504.1 hypothetical protein [Streptomyces sp. SID8357]MYT84352.1 hypothetical protein [Streptomyces sp. SID8360]MYW37619.1 hypothetical protein [Streptomyces sp. SID1]